MVVTKVSILNRLIKAFKQGGFGYLFRYFIKSFDKWFLQKKITCKAVWLKDIFPFDKTIKNKYNNLLSFKSAGLTLLVDHSSGGGANSFSEQWINKYLLDGGVVARFVYFPSFKLYILEVKDLNSSFVIKERSLDLIAEFIKWICPNRLLINELVGWPDINEIISFLKSFSNSTLEIWIHDYFCICPSYTLLNSKGVYCGVPDENACTNCLPNNNYVPLGISTTIKAWREQWRYFLEKANIIYVPDRSVQDIICQAYPNLIDKIKVTPHAPIALWKPLVQELEKDYPVIGVIGTILEHKGSKIVKDMVQILETTATKGMIVVIGELEPLVKSPKLLVTKSYSHADLPNIILEHKINVGLVPSIWPETFSYTSLEITQLGLPLVCFDLGAQGERAKKYSKGFISKRIDAKSCLEACLLAYKENTNNFKY